MKLVVDLAGLDSASRFRGIGRYTRGLVAGLLRNKDQHDVWLVASASQTESLAAIRADFSELIPSSHIVPYETLRCDSYHEPTDRWRRMASELVKEHVLASLEPDVILHTSIFEGFRGDVFTSIQPLAGTARRVAIAYDLIPARNPDHYLPSPAIRAWYADKLRAFSSSHLFLAISDSAGKEVAADLKIPPERIISIMGGADEFSERSTYRSSQKILTAEDWHIDKPYFIYTATYEKRKNFETLLKAFGRLSKRIVNSYKLVLVTSNEPAVIYEIKRITQMAGVNYADIVITGNISDAHLRHLYENCLAMVYPSTHEGFGLPILEAMHCDAAVIGANTSSIPEIIGLQEAMFDPYSVEALAEMMMRITSDEKYRQRLKKNAVARRALFNWDRTARAAWRALERIPDLGDQRGRTSRSSCYGALISAIRAIPPAHAHPTPTDLRELANVVATNLDAIDSVSPRTANGGRRAYRLEGPFDSTYSLALLNRETARALKAKGEFVVLHSTEGPGDYRPDEAFLQKNHPDILPLFGNNLEDWQNRSLIISRNLYPPRVNDAAGAGNFLHHYAWEESRFPTEWVDQFNLHLDGLTCLSTHVMKVLQDNGVAVPMKVSGAGVDHWESIVPGPEVDFPGKTFRFLHVSSCFPRKGADVLLAAYGKAFRQADDVTLIIKTFENPHNTIRADLQALQASDPDFPDVLLIFDDLPDAKLKALYRHCQVLVAPSRAEGYGLPLAEAMLTGIPVIATGWSGQLDFCNEETSWLVDYQYVPAKTHFEMSSSVWAEPDCHHLAERMREAHAASPTERARKAAAGRELLLAQHKWSDVVDRFCSAVDDWAAQRPPPPHRIGWITTWNCECGIATYSEHLIRWLAPRPIIFGAIDDALITPDEDGVVRAWQKAAPGSSLQPLAEAVEQSKVDVIVIQFNFGFFDFENLKSFVLEQKQNDRTVLITLHSTIDPPGYPEKKLSNLADVLRACDRVLVHSHHDLNRLKEIGVVTNATLFPHGVIDGPASNFAAPPSHAPFTVGSYGFCLPHKGLRELVKAFSILAQADPLLTLQLFNAEYPVDLSKDLARDLRADIEALGLTERAQLRTEFLPDETALAHLSQCNLLVFPYEKTGESASGAVRFGLATGRPVLTTDLPIFEDVKALVFQATSNEPATLAGDIAEIINRLRVGDSSIADRARAAEKWRRENSYEALASRLAGLIKALRLERFRG
ncbi:glycosyltransferase [Phreatobacter sp. AB_2022a]|uniref:glycosyltransferase n=1 Tax=Phreatobacter sp. AB_2022a TaxID=3003134 RepID=UPI0022874008|nr:glycosyltransferase [Phreatobacter sp. AB_2022a]MCZ0733005.1 glycosyltransferase [Phreatobacter sp. AB_2022a]